MRMRVSVQNALQSIALKHALRRGAGLWSRHGQEALSQLPLAPHAGMRRQELMRLYAQLEREIKQLDEAVKAVAEQRPQARLLMTHPGVGPITALATEVFLGDATRSADGKAFASYVGMIPSETSSGPSDAWGS